MARSYSTTSYSSSGFNTSDSLPKMKKQEPKTKRSIKETQTSKIKVKPVYKNN